MGRKDLQHQSAQSRHEALCRPHIQSGERLFPFLIAVFVFPDCRHNTHSINVMAPDKRKTNNQRFFLWDYLWWTGEQWQRFRPVSRVDGSTVLFGYILAPIIVPLIFLFYRLFPGTAIIQVIAWCLVILAGHSLVERIYRRRVKAVLKHYAKRNFHEAIAVLFVPPLDCHYVFSDVLLRVLYPETISR